MKMSAGGQEEPSNSALVTKIDEIAEWVEEVRAKAAFMIEEKDAIYMAIDAVTYKLKHSDGLVSSKRDELVREVEQITARVNDISVTIEVKRDAEQEDALSEVNELINRTIILSAEDSVRARSQCMRYLNTCRSEQDAETDQMFERVLLGCALDDQKRIRKRLSGLLVFLEKTSKLS